MAVDSEFGRFIQANLSYWQQQLAALNNPAIPTSESEQENLVRVLRFGLGFPRHQQMAIHLLTDLFPYFEQQADWHVAKSLLQHTETILSLPDTIRQTTLNQLGAFHRLSGQAAQAITYHQQALAAIQNPTRLQRTQHHFYLATAYYRLHKYVAAQEQAEQALNLLEDSAETNIHLAASLHNTRGLIAVDIGDRQTALSHLKRSLKSWQALGNITYQIVTLNNLGQTYHKDGAIADAIECYEQALQLLKKGGSTVEGVRVHANLGVLYCELAAFEKALDIFLKANTHSFCSLADYRLQASLANNIGYTLSKLSRFAEAAHYLKQAAILWESMGDDLNYGNTIGELGCVYQQLNELAKAKYHLKMAIEKLTPFSDNNWAAQENANYLACLRRLEENN